MKVEIDISEDLLTEKMTELIAKDGKRNYTSGGLVQKSIEKAVDAVIKNMSAQLVERAVEYASYEIARAGLHELVERYDFVQTGTGKEEP